MDHQTTQLLVPITVDVAIAPLIQECWRIGTTTRFCCEGDPRAKTLNPKRVTTTTALCGYICFVGLSTAEVVASLIQEWLPTWEHHLEKDSRYNNSVVRFHRRDLETMTAALRAIPTEDGLQATALCF